MSGFFSKSLVTLAKRTVQSSTSKYSLIATTCSRKPLFTLHNVTRKFGCAGQLHQKFYSTKADLTFSAYLENEIKEEKESSLTHESEGKKFEDWNIEYNGADVKMNKKHKGETIVIEFSVLHSTQLNEDDFEEGDDEGDLNAVPPGSLVSRPPFVVEIQKKSGKRLRFSCSFNSTGFSEDDEEGSLEDLFIIDYVSVFEGEVSESHYICHADSMEEEMYGKLLEMLKERDIDNDFVQTLEDFSTQYENKEYVKFLEELKSFVDDK